MTTLRAGAATDKGRTRPINQDDMLVTDRLFVVADGMGGHLGGEVASAMAVEAMREEVIDPTSESLLAGAQAANKRIFDRSNDDPTLHGMGTTLCAVALVDNDDGHELAVINVGDSRAYLFRDQTLSQITRDHSLIEDLRQEGRLSEEELAVHPHRNVITRALGIAGRVEVDEFTVIPHRGDRLIICSDGLFNEVPNVKIASTLRRLADPEEAAHELVRQANENGGRDNITCIVVDVVDDDGRDHSAAVSAAPSRPRPAGRADLAGFTTAIAEHDDADPPVADTGDGEPAHKQGRKPRADDPDATSSVRARRFTWRVAGFIVLLATLFAATAGVVWWYARGTYYLGFDANGQVTLYQGRAEKFLWFQATALERTQIPAAQVPEQFKDAVTAGKAWGSRGEAEQYLANIRTVICNDARANASTSAQTSAPTSSAPGRGPTTTLPLGCVIDRPATSVTSTSSAPTTEARMPTSTRAQPTNSIPPSTPPAP